MLQASVCDSCSLDALSLGEDCLGPAEVDVGRRGAHSAGHLSAKEMVAADPDHDGTLTKDEYLAVVEQRSAPPIPIAMGPWMQRNCIQVPGSRSFGL